ncbi:hypothetical protein H2202_003294 [Exophiala xenobiotica]|nr:hypothetical protein H2202_003294 [Exophiala xenobiotica]
MPTANVGQSTSKSPEQGLGRDPKLPARKRRRPALSCQQCRNRKVKCDRKFPSCDTCARIGQAHLCAYSDDIFLPMERKGPVPRRVNCDGGSERNGRSKSPIPRLRAPPIYKPRQGMADPAMAESLARAIPAAEDPLTKRYPDTSAAVAGQTSTQVTKHSIRNFDGVRTHTKEVKLEIPTISNLRTDFEVFMRNCKEKDVVDDRSLNDLLPPRKTADELVDVYLDCVEPTHRVLHIPSFRREYTRYWGSPQTAAPGLVALLLAMMAGVLVLHNSSAASSMDVGPALRETALEWVEAAESFLQRRTRRPDLRIFQICCLSIMARRVNGLSENQAFIATGSLVKRAMSAGYHREINDYAQVSPFSAEMRRRIWATIVELDLQASVDRGMPPSNSSELPTAEPAEELTDSAFQAVLTTSISLRLRICAWANSANIELDYDTALNMDEELSRHLNSIPVWGRPAVDDASNQQRSRIRVLLELTLRQYVILLHTPFASLSQQISKYAHSRRTRLEAATTILCQFRDMLQPSANNVIRCIMPSDSLQAALTVCHELYMDDTGYGSSPILRVAPNFAESLLSLAETALAAIETQMYTIGKKAPEFYVLAMVRSLVEVRLWPASAEANRSKAAEQILRAGQRLFTWKMQAQTEKTSRRNVSNGRVPTAIRRVLILPDLSKGALAYHKGPVMALRLVNHDFGFLDGQEDIFGAWNVEDFFNF